MAAAIILLFLTLCGPLPKVKHRFIVVSHRGDHTQAPENTLEAYSNAIKDGVDFVEIDLRTTVDSQLVIMHDATVDRMTNGKGFVKDLTLDTIRSLKIRGEFRVPTFKEVLNLCKGKVNIYLDFKNADPAQAYKEIVAAGMENQVVVYLNAPQQYYKWRAAAPDMPLMVSLPGSVKKDTSSMKDFLGKARVEILDGDYTEYTADMVNVANRLGYLVLPDIQGSKEGPELWSIPIGMGIRALQTDHPVDLIHYLEEQHLR